MDDKFEIRFARLTEIVEKKDYKKEENVELQGVTNPCQPTKKDNVRKGESPRRGAKVDKLPLYNMHDSMCEPALRTKNTS